MNPFNSTPLLETSLDIARFTRFSHAEVKTVIEDLVSKDQIALPKKETREIGYLSAVPCYVFPTPEAQEDALVVVSSISAAALKALSEEDVSTTPKYPTAMSEVAAEIAFFHGAATLLDLTPFEKSQLVANLGARYEMPVMLVEALQKAALRHTDDPAQQLMPAAAATRLLRERSVAISTMKFNLLLEQAGMVERFTRTRRDGSLSPYWSVTEKGQEFGRNVLATHTDETQPHWFIARFDELLLSLGIQVPTEHQKPRLKTFQELLWPSSPSPDA